MRYGTSNASKLDRDKALGWAAAAIAWAQDAIELADEQLARVDTEPSG
jgi:hypothetical protein